MILNNINQLPQLKEMNYIDKQYYHVTTSVMSHHNMYIPIHCTVACSSPDTQYLKSTRHSVKRDSSPLQFGP